MHFTTHIFKLDVHVGFHQNGPREVMPYVTFSPLRNSESFSVHPNTSITIMIEMYYYEFTKDAEV